MNRKKLCLQLLESLVLKKKTSSLIPSNEDNHPDLAKANGLAIDFPSSSNLKPTNSDILSRDIGDYISQEINDCIKCVLFETTPFKQL